MSTTKKILIALLILLLIGLVVFGIFSERDSDVINDNDIELIIDDNGLFDDDNSVEKTDEDAPKREHNDISDEVDDLEKKIEEVLRLFDPIEETVENGEDNDL